MSDPYAPPLVEEVSAPVEVSGDLPHPDAPVGVGGWLRLYCIVLTVLGPLLWTWQLKVYGQLIVANRGQYPRFSLLLTLEIAIWGLLMVFGVVVGLWLWARRKGALAAVRAFMLSRLLGVFSLLFVSAAFGLMPDTRHFGNLGIVLIREALYFVIWWFYFKKSKRVANTYQPVPSA
ncbi:DUF2569 family protein [Luteolibacter sp. LG18]|uniref:DUF2569 family protein n=1 Tax=Luteolibacter sp. LG18 TaxID=2819286 RepID=UPI002B297181|nr:hypothetical protein llg_25240 [Luteolibacter sp. LG18]